MTTRHFFHGSTVQSRRLIKYPPFLGSSVIVGTYLCFLWFTDKEQTPEFYPDHLSATLVRRLPLNTVSRLMCWVAECQVPAFLRPIVYGSYARVFGCDLNELKESDLKSYRSVSDFFTRELAQGSRPIDPKAELVSPADGQILHFGPIDPDYQVLEQVKGVSYSLPEFLGPPESGLDQKTVYRKPDIVWPSIDAAKGHDRQLYQCVIYLAPGDCHRFYNPADWTATIRRHFPGKLLSVRPTLAARVPGLYTINERVVYLGQWAHGFMSFAAIGSVGVGGICVPDDPALVTNACADQPARVRALGSSRTSFNQAQMPAPGLGLHKGQEFGRFRFGSTIVLVFEAPRAGVSWPIQVGQHIKMGQALIRLG